MLLDPLTAVVAVATVLGGAMAIPQAWKILRVRSTNGVSPVWAGISITLNGWWTAYAVAVDDFAIVPVSVLAIGVYLVIVGGLLRFGAAPSTAASAVCAGALGGLLAPLAVLAVGGWTATGIALGLLYGVQLSPAVVTVYRSDDVRGVAASSWVIAAVEALIWIVYGLARLDAGIISFGVTGLAAAALVLIRLAVRRPRGRRTGVAVPQPGLLPA